MPVLPLPSFENKFNNDEEMNADSSEINTDV